MEPEVVKAVDELLHGLNRFFNYGVDLGCGYGKYASILKKYVGFLVGVDLDPARLSVAVRMGYDAVVKCNILNFQIPNECDVVFLFDVVEHLPKELGYELLYRIGSRTVILTTPSRYFPIALNGHVSLWSIEDFRNLGFKVIIIELHSIKKMFYGEKILAYRI